MSIALLGVILAGGFLVSGYGRSTDEFTDFNYAEDSLKAFLGVTGYVGDPYEEFHGPFHLEVAYLVGKLAASLPISWTETDARHFANYSIFVVGLGGLYLLARRLVGVYPAALTVALFATQPMLFGQAFINQKDTPFLAYFTLSIAAGMFARDRLERASKKTSAPYPKSEVGSPNLVSEARREFFSLDTFRQWLLVIAVAILVWFTVDILFGFQFLPISKQELSLAYHGQALPLLQAWFDRVATDAYKTPLNLYMQKLDMVYGWMSGVMVLVGVSGLALLLRWQMPSTTGTFVHGYGQGVGAFIAAGVLLGLTDSIRVAAPLAGLLISTAVLTTCGKRAVPALIAYWGAAAWVTYMTWPLLWRSPLASYWQSVQVMSDFPSHDVLFAGTVLPSQSIPWDYVPRLIATQTTEVVVPLALAGLAVGLWGVRRARLRRGDLFVVVAWLVLPTTLVIGLHSSLYGNLRQMLFVLPPLFLLGGLALESLLTWIRHWAARPILWVLLIPGILGIFRLHPYEYTYFNAWVGGVSGAYGQYQVDPWCTSYRQAIDYVNAVAPPGAVVDVRGPIENAGPFGRKDLMLRPDYSLDPTPDYALMCQVDIQGDRFYDNLPIIYQVTRGKAVLAVVRGKPPKGGS